MKSKFGVSSQYVVQVASTADRLYVSTKLERSSEALTFQEQEQKSVDIPNSVMPLVDDISHVD